MLERAVCARNFQGSNLDKNFQGLVELAGRTPLAVIPGARIFFFFGGGGRNPAMNMLCEKERLRVSFTEYRQNVHHAPESVSERGIGPVSK